MTKRQKSSKTPAAQGFWTCRFRFKNDKFATFLTSFSRILPIFQIFKIAIFENFFKNDKNDKKKDK